MRELLPTNLQKMPESGLGRTLGVYSQESWAWLWLRDSRHSRLGSGCWKQGRRETAATPVFLPGESHGQRSPVGYSLSSRKESDTTERPALSFLSAFTMNRQPRITGHLRKASNMKTKTVREKREFKRNSNRRKHFLKNHIKQEKIIQRDKTMYSWKQVWATRIWE